MNVSCVFLCDLSGYLSLSANVTFAVSIPADCIHGLGFVAQMTRVTIKILFSSAAIKFKWAFFPTNIVFLFVEISESSFPLNFCAL